MLYEGLLERKLENWANDIKNQYNLPIELSLWNGKRFQLGSQSQPAVDMYINSAGALPALLNASLDSLGEAYIEQQIDIKGRLSDAIQVAYKLANISQHNNGLIRKATEILAHSKKQDREAIKYHYDVSNDFYRLWLDENMVYSCGYFEDGTETLEEAQVKKIDHILRKIQLKPGQRLLDIGCGWGALAIRAARNWGARCVGVTLSEKQYEFARERVKREGLEELVEIRLQDYRDVQGTFERITSVGMFEHVGLANLPEYFSKISSLLSQGGWAMNHGITSTDAESAPTPMGGSEFIDKYVFPHGELPHISLVLKTMQACGLETFDVENLRRHYARTLDLWTQRYEAQANTLRQIVDEKTYRIWRIYLAGCSHAFHVDNVAIFQVICQKAEQESSTLPWSRHYIYKS